MILTEFRICDLQQRLIEQGDSSKSDVKSKDEEITHSSKVVRKRLSDTVGSDMVEDDAGLLSTNKPVKVMCIKTEKD